MILWKVGINKPIKLISLIVTWWVHVVFQLGPIISELESAKNKINVILPFSKASNFFIGCIFTFVFNFLFVLKYFSGAIQLLHLKPFLSFVALEKMQISGWSQTMSILVKHLLTWYMLMWRRQNLNCVLIPKIIYLYRATQATFKFTCIMDKMKRIFRVEIIIKQLLKNIF